MKYSITLLACLFLLINTCKAQVTQQWVARYNGSGNWQDVVISVAVDDSGNVYVTGYSNYMNGNSGAYDIITIKYNSSGVQQWIRRYDGGGVGCGKRIALDGSRNVYLTGYVYVLGNGTGIDYVTIKYNSSGVQEWVQRYNGPGNSDDLASSLAVDNSDNVYVTGYSSGSGTDYDYVTIKYNSSGVQEWVQRYNGPANQNDFARSVAVDYLGNVLVTGESDVGSSSDCATIKYNSSGVQQWVQRFSGGSAYSLVVDNSGNCYVTGLGYSYGWGCATIKYNSSGVQQWVQLYTGNWYNNNFGKFIALDNSGNVYVSGRASHGPSNQDFDYLTMKYNSSGVQQWVQIYNGPSNGEDDPHSMVVDGSGNVYVTGSSYNNGTNYDYATIKYNSSGLLQWIQTYNGPGNHLDDAYSITVDTSGNVYVGGGSYGNGTGYDYATIKYSQLVGIKPTPSEIPSSYKLYQNYPNPFNPASRIKFDIPTNSTNTKLVIYDMLGSEVSKLVNEELKPGTYEVEWDASNYPSGIYFYKLITGDFTDSKKMSLVK